MVEDADRSKKRLCHVGMESDAAKERSSRAKRRGKEELKERETGTEVERRGWGFGEGGLVGGAEQHAATTG